MQGEMEEESALVADSEPEGEDLLEDAEKDY